MQERSDERTGSVSVRLREATREAHGLLERVPFLEALSRGDLHRPDYLGYLHALSIVHGVLETLTSRSADAGVGAVWRESMRKLPLLESDIASVEGGDLTCTSGSVGQALQFAQEMRMWSLTEPARLVGALYVLEGSTNGGRVLAPRVQASLGLGAHDGVRYLRAYGDDQAAAWHAFTERIDGEASVQERYDEVLEGALGTYGGVSRIAETIGEGPRRVHATALNPEAGSHGVPQDPDELEAVRQAASVCLDEIPYVVARYGERGRRFTLSDGAWLATLSEFPAAVVYRQVEWLGRFLSGLGVARVILERHLRETQRVFAEALPARAGEFDVLIAAADRLAVAAHEVLPEEQRARVRKVLRAEAGLPGHFEEVWLSMIADEIAYAHGALDGTLSWLNTEAPWGSGVAEVCRRSLEVVEERLTP